MNKLKLHPGHNQGNGYIVRDSYLFFDGMDNVLVDDFIFINCGEVQAEGAHHIGFNNCRWIEQKGGSNQQIKLVEGNDFWTFTNCGISGAENGIYLRNQPRAPSNFSAFGCTFSNIGWYDRPTKDGHGIGVQGGSGHLVMGNTFVNCGTPIEFWAPGGTVMEDITVDNNYIRNTRICEVTMGSGIVISGSSPQTLGLRQNIRITNNQIFNTAGNAIRSNIEDEITIEDNYYENYGTGGVNKDAIYCWNENGSKVIQSGNTGSIRIDGKLVQG